MRIDDSKLRRRIVDLVEQIASQRQALRNRAAFARRDAGIRPLFAHILTAQMYAATTAQVSAAETARGFAIESTRFEGRSRGVFRSGARQLSVHQRVRFGRASRQGLRSDFRRHPRCLHRERRQARHRRRQPGEYPARLRDAVHDQQDRHRRRRPRPGAVVPQDRRQGGGQSRDDHRRSRAAWSRTSATTRTASPITAPTSRCCCTASRPISPWASTPRRRRAARKKAPATRA